MKHGWRRALAAIAAMVVAGSGVFALAADLRVATYNVEDIGAEGSSQYRALVQVLRRMDADVVLIQEVDAEAGDLARVARLAKDAGYAHRCVSEVSGTLSGDLHNAGLSRFPIGNCASWSAAELSGRRRANDITRDVLEIGVRSGGVLWGLFAVHLKGGPRNGDRFRRQVELLRVTRAMSRFRAKHPDSPIVLGGDFNEDVRRGPFGKPVFRKLPRGLPPSYRLGADVRFPVVYDPFGLLRAEGFVMVAAVQEPGDPATRWVSGRRIDYLWIGSGVGVEAAEVYDSCDDSGEPAAGMVPKAGAPLPCGRTGEASDHFGVLAVLTYRERVRRSTMGDR